MGLLYQEIMNVPGLTGTWKERCKQYNEALGRKGYDGTRDTGMFLLSQIKAKNFPQVQQQAVAQPQVATQDLATQYAQPGVQAGEAANVPQFQEAMPFYDAWGRLVPQATLAAESQVNPEAQRQFKSSYSDYMSGLTSSGGQRFGRGLQGGGELKAQAERSRLGNIQDWLNQYQQGYKTLFYEPSQTAWNQAITQGRTPDNNLKDMPTWDKFAEQYGANDMSGSTSPFYG